jgi:uncharacterized membrane protein
MMSFLTVLVTMLSIDGIWLLLMKDSYSKSLGHLMAKEANLIAAISFYLLYTVGVMVFLINPQLKNKDTFEIFQRAFLFGVIAYSTYDLTNLATLKNWPIGLTLVDIFWGGVMTSLTVLISMVIIKYFKFV